MASHKAIVGILSIGDMGAGVARLLGAHNFKVITNVSRRSQATQDRVRAVGVEPLPSDEDLVLKSDYVLSIVPPRDAHATAQRVADAVKSTTRSSESPPLYFLDLNAVAPSSARAVRSLFQGHEERVRVIDGGIIGGPPTLDEASGKWSRPSIVLSGPDPLTQAAREGAALFDVLNGKHVGDEIGVASGLKCCFGALTKGFASLAIQSFSTAAQLGVLDELQDHLAERFPQVKAFADRGVVGMPPKAYRWVDEMKEIGKTFSEDGGWSEGWGDGVFSSIADVYRFVADATVLGEEKTESRKRKNVEDIVDALADGLKKPRPS